MRQIIVSASGGAARIPDDEPETDLDALIGKYWDSIQWNVDDAWIEE